MALEEKQNRRVTVYLKKEDLVLLLSLWHLYDVQNHVGRVTISSVVAHAIRMLYREKIEGKGD